MNGTVAAGMTNHRMESRGVRTELDEQTLLEDIRYFEGKVRDLDRPTSAYERAMLRVYGSLLAHRRQLLMAYRDGRPEAWFEYDHVAL